MQVNKDMTDNLFGKLKGSLEQVTNTVANLPIPEQTKGVLSKSVDLTKDFANQSVNVFTNSVEQAKTTVNKGIDFAKEDLQANGTWLYKTLQISINELEELEDKLNVLGKEKWELIQLVDLKQAVMLILKKPNAGYIANTVKLATGREL